MLCPDVRSLECMTHGEFAVSMFYVIAVLPPKLFHKVGC
jgi:hypothetical protein